MKKLIRIAFAVVFVLTAPATANAQLSDVLKNTAGSLLGNSNVGNVAGDVVGDIVANLLGTNKLTEENLVGTWTYSEPCAVMESEDVLGKLGSSVITNKLEQEQEKLLTKVGFTAGKVVLVLNKDKSGTITVGTRTIKLSWAVSESNLNLTILRRTIKVNANMEGGNLQLAMNADKLLDLVSTVTTKVSKVSSSFGTISKLLEKYEGLYLGLKFKKK